MREPNASDLPGSHLYGLLAEFDHPESLMDAARETRATGFRQFETFTPFPVEDLAEISGFTESKVPMFTLFGGVFGAALGFGMQVYANLDYPLNVGGRPLVASTAFMLITFEMTILFAVLFGIGAMFVLNRLPRLHHPLFDAEGFRLASLDRFFLVVLSNDPKFDSQRTHEFLKNLRPISVVDVLMRDA